MTQTNNNVKKLVAFVFTAAIVSMCSVVAANAVESDVVTVNNQQYNVDDTITYILKMGDIPTPVIGVDMSLYYDSSCLTLMTDTVNIPTFTGAVCNKELDGEIKFNAVEVNKGYDFSQEEIAISASFKVKKTNSDKESTDITYTVRELYGLNQKDAANPINIVDYKASSNIVLGTLDDITPADDGSSRLNQLQQQENQQSLQNTNNNEQGVKPWIIILEIVGGVIIAGILIYVLVKKQKNKGT